MADLEVVADLDSASCQRDGNTVQTTFSFWWAHEDLEDLADCWEELAAGYMRRKLGGG